MARLARHPLRDEGGEGWPPADLPAVPQSLGGRLLPARGGGRRRLRVLLNEVSDARLDLAAETRAVEDAVMADAHREKMLFLVVRQIGAERVRRLGLADAGNVVALAF